MQSPQSENQDDQQPENAPEEEEEVRDGEISVKEYDYLLTMQIMSLTERE